MIGLACCLIRALVLELDFHFHIGAMVEIDAMSLEEQFVVFAAVLI
jgi:hypothetical protein